MDLYHELDESVTFGNRFLVTAAHRVGAHPSGGERALVHIIYKPLVEDLALIRRYAVEGKEEELYEQVAHVLRHRVRRVGGLYPLSSQQEILAHEQRLFLYVLSMAHSVIPDDVHRVAQEMVLRLKDSETAPLDVILSYYGCEAANERLASLDPEIRMLNAAMFRALGQLPE